VKHNTNFLITRRAIPEVSWASWLLFTIFWFYNWLFKHYSRSWTLCLLHFIRLLLLITIIWNTGLCRELMPKNTL